MWAAALNQVVWFVADKTPVPASELRKHFLCIRTAGHRTRTQGRGHGTRSRSDALARAGASTAIDAGRAVDACTGEGRAAARPRGLECVEYFIKRVKYMSV